MGETEEQFWAMVAELIDNANQKGMTESPGLISDAMLYAAARFNAYTAAATTTGRAEFKAELVDIKALLMEQFEVMLEANLQDYLENYKMYLER